MGTRARHYTRARTRGYGVDRCRHTCRSEMSNIERARAHAASFQEDARVQNYSTFELR